MARGQCVLVEKKFQAPPAFSRPVFLFREKTKSAKQWGGGGTQCIETKDAEFESLLFKGLEPLMLSAIVPKTTVFTNFTRRANKYSRCENTFFL